MSKVTIKFWDRETGFSILDRDGFVFDHNSDELDYLEPHFYKDGERIA